MKTQKKDQTDMIVEAIESSLRLRPSGENFFALEKQITKIVRNLLDDIDRLDKKKLALEMKRIRRELKRQKNERILLAARQILSGQAYT